VVPEHSSLGKGLAADGCIIMKKAAPGLVVMTRVEVTVISSDIVTCSEPKCILELVNGILRKYYKKLSRYWFTFSRDHIAT
jgi:hypothetical protein